MVSKNAKAFTTFSLHKPGFTLIEILISVAILAVITLVVGSILISHLNLFNNVKQLVDISSSNKLALDELISQIREGSSIVSTCSNCNGDTTSSTVLVLQLWPLDAAKNPFEPTADYDYVIYKRDATDNKKLIKKIVADPASSRTNSTKVMAADITNLTFSYDNATPSLASEITVEVANTLTIANKTQTVSQQVKAVLRNK